MPRSAARIFIRITNVRVERLQDITEEDAEAEGCSGTLFYSNGEPQCYNVSPVEQYIELWDEINGKKQGYRWGDNPWVFVIEFERVEAEK